MTYRVTYTRPALDRVLADFATDYNFAKPSDCRDFERRIEQTLQYTPIKMIREIYPEVKGRSIEALAFGIAREFIKSKAA